MLQRSLGNVVCSFPDRGWDGNRDIQSKYLPQGCSSGARRMIVIVGFAAVGVLVAEVQGCHLIATHNFLCKLLLTFRDWLASILRGCAEGTLQLNINLDLCCEPVISKILFSPQ